MNDVNGYRWGQLQLNYEGQLMINGNRMILLQADTLGYLRQELIHALGVDIARNVLTRFGFNSGYNDLVMIQRTLGLTYDDPELILAGPKTHTLEGIVRADCQELRFDQRTGYFFMSGTWYNSYEADQHIRMMGISEHPVCWTLVGYASGYATAFMGRKIVAVERKCKGKGDSYCEYELRPAEEWGPEFQDYIKALEPMSTVRSLQQMLQIEKKRSSQWRILAQTSQDLFKLGNVDDTLEKYVFYARNLLMVQQAVIIQLPTQSNYIYQIYRAKGSYPQVIKETAVNLDEFVYPLLEINEVVVGSKRDFSEKSLLLEGIDTFLSVILREKGQPRGLLIVADRQDGKPFTSEDKELLSIFSSELSLGLTNLALYSQLEMRLEEKTKQLDIISEELRKEHETLKQSVLIHNRLMDLVLSGKDISQIANVLANMVGNPIWIQDEHGSLLARAVPDGMIDKTISLNMNTIQKIDLANTVEGKQKKVFRISGQLMEDKQTYQSIAPVVAGEKIVGYVGLIEAFKPISDIEIVALEQGATIIALEMLKNKVVFETELRLKGDLMNRLLHEEIADENEVLVQAKSLGIDLVQPWRVLLVEFKITKQLDTILEKFILELRKKLGGILVTRRSQQVIILVEVVSKPLSSVTKLLENLLQGLAKDQWWMAVGAEGKSAREVFSSYVQALKIIQLQKSLFNRKRIVFYEDLSVFGMLQLDIEGVRLFTQKVLGPLLEHDAKFGSKYIQTLQLLFQHNGNVMKAAKASFLSPGTIRYRLERIEELSGLNLEDPESLLQLRLALKLIQET